MKILLTGKNGQVGFELQRALSPLGELIAVDRIRCDLANEDALRQCIRETKPHVIVNAAAYTAVDKAETDRELAEAINHIALGVIGEEAKSLDALVIHYSTDYVFDGLKDSPYDENDTPNPQSVYGASKLAGERALQTSWAKHIILRTSWVVGAHGGNFAKTMLKLATERDALKIIADQFGAPTSASLLADVTAQIIRQITLFKTPVAPYGIYHFTASGETNWYAYACYVIEKARVAGLDLRVAPQGIVPITTAEYITAAKRPTNSRLNTNKLKTTFDMHLPTWQVGVDHILEQIL
jgi:dTDP-4-dehydrorhamnose reductase